MYSIMYGIMYGITGFDCEVLLRVFKNYIRNHKIENNVLISVFNDM